MSFNQSEIQFPPGPESDSFTSPKQLNDTFEMLPNDPLISDPLSNIENTPLNVNTIILTSSPIEKHNKTIANMHSKRKSSRKDKR